jgi:hypothetical protein
MLETVEAKDGHTTWLESVLEFILDAIDHLLGSGPYLDDRDDFGFGIRGDSRPDILPGVFDRAQSSSNWTCSSSKFWSLNSSF